MCGRIYQTLNPDQVRSFLGANGEIRGYNKCYRSYNTAPTAYMPVAYRQTMKQNNSTTTKKDLHEEIIPDIDVEAMRWGVSLGNLFVINGRMEELTQKFFKRFLNKRCVVVFDGYYEWKTVGNQKEKPPYLIIPKKGEEESKASKEKVKR